MSEPSLSADRALLIEKRWVALFAFVGGTLGIALVQLQLILWMRGGFL